MSTETTTAVVEAPVVPTVVANRSRLNSNSYILTVDQIDNTAFKNIRKNFKAHRILEYRHSLKEVGQIQSLSGVQLESGKFGLVAGFTRYEAFSQNVHDPLINKWNREHDLKSDDPNWLVVTNPLHREMVAKAYSEEFDKEKNKEYNLIDLIVDVEVKTAADARVRNFGENFWREDFTVLEMMDGIEEMIVTDKMKAKDVAKLLKKSEGYISQFRKARKLPDRLLSFLVVPEEGEDIKETELVKATEDAKLLVQELLRRMDLAADDPEAVGLSHLREFASRVVVDEGKLPLTRKQVFEFLCELVGADVKSHKLVAKRPTVGYNSFVAKLKSYEEETLKRRSGKGVDATTETADTTETTTGTVEGLAAQQGNIKAEAGLTTPVTEPAAKPSDVAAEANADVKQAPAAGNTEVGIPATTPHTPEVPSATEDTKEVDSVKKAAEMVGLDPTELQDDDEDEAGPVGAKNRKTVAAPIDNIKVKEPNFILAAIKTMLEQANGSDDEQDKNCAMTAACIHSAAFGYEVLGLSEKQKELEEAATKFCDDMEEYVLSLEEFAMRAGKLSNKKLGQFEGQRPVFVLKKDSEGDDVGDEGEGDADDFDVNELSDEDIESMGDEDGEAEEDIADLRSKVGKK